MSSDENLPAAGALADLFNQIHDDVMRKGYLFIRDGHRMEKMEGEYVRVTRRLDPYKGVSDIHMLGRVCALTCADGVKELGLFQDFEVRAFAKLTSEGKVVPLHRLDEGRMRDYLDAAAQATLKFTK